MILYALNCVTDATLAEMASIILHDEEKNEFIFYSTTDTPEHRKRLNEIRFPADRGIAGSVFKTGVGELILDVPNDPRHFKSPDDATGFETESMIVVPLRTTEKTIGVMEALNKKDGIFSTKELDFITALSPVIALALDNARAHTELENAYHALKLVDLGKDDLIEQTKSELALARQELERNYRFDQIIGNSEAMMKVFRWCERAIDSDITVLIEGETGTGKDLIARAIHHNSPRKEKPFVAQNCAGLVDNLLESELFGHKKGAFTGALKDKRGIFSIADGGTVFLDEVAEMSAAMQPKLLRVLQSGEIRALGAENNEQVDVRLISATNKELSEEKENGNFREDLYYRLDVFKIEMPPLRERKGDIPILSRYFLERSADGAGKAISGFTPEAMACLSAYPFPGNVRELENEIERAVAMVVDEKLIDQQHLSERIVAPPEPDAGHVELQGTLKEMKASLDKTVLVQTLEKHGGNITRAARELGYSRNGLTKMIRRHGLSPSRQLS